MATEVRSYHIATGLAPLLAEQARRKRLGVSARSRLYLREKALEGDFPTDVEAQRKAETE